MAVTPSFGIGHPHAVDHFAMPGKLAPDLPRHVAVDSEIGEEAGIVGTAGNRI